MIPRNINLKSYLRVLPLIWCLTAATFSEMAAATGDRNPVGLGNFTDVDNGATMTAGDGHPQFRENKGQVSDQFGNPRSDVLFSGEDAGLIYHLRRDGVSYQIQKVNSKLQGDEGLSGLERFPFGPSLSLLEGKVVDSDSITCYRVDLRWLGANQGEVQKVDEVDGFENYYLPVCPDGVLGVKSYHEVTYMGIYPGIDLRWHAKDGHLKYDFVVGAGADHRLIQIEVKGATGIRINELGSLVIETPLGELIEDAPIVMQGMRQLEARWVVDADHAWFDISGLEPGQPFIIDPSIRLWGTYYGGPGSSEFALNCDTDPSGNVFMTGPTTSSINIATSGSFETVYTGGINQHAYLVKFNSTGTRQWGTYYNNVNSGRCVADALGNVFLCGTNTGTFPIGTPGSYQMFNAGGFDGILAKFDANGARQWMTYYGGPGVDVGLHCDMDQTGNLYLVGRTMSTTGIATPGCHQPSYAGGGSSDLFMVKFNSAGWPLWATYYGGPADEGWPYTTTDPLGNIYLCASTQSSSGIATPGSFQPVIGGGYDGFLAKFDGAGTQQWATYFGGSGTDGFGSCSLFGGQDLFVSGHSNSIIGIATAGSFQPTYGGGFNDGFLAKFNTNGNRQWATYVGGPSNESGVYCTTNPAGEIFVAGLTNSTTNIATSGAYSALYTPAAYDCFLAKFSYSGMKTCATYFGGPGNEIVHSIEMDPAGNVYFAGSTTSTSGVSTLGSCQTAYGGGNSDAFLVKFAGNCPIVLPEGEIGPLDYPFEVCLGDCPVLRAKISAGNPAMSVSFDDLNLYLAGKRVGEEMIVDDLCFRQAGSMHGKVMVDGQTVALIQIEVKECEKKASIKTSPNPYSETFTLSIDSWEDGPLRVEMHDLMGRKVLQIVETNLRANEYYSLEVTPTLPHGIYLVKVTIGANVQTVKIVQQ